MAERERRLNDGVATPDRGHRRRTRRRRSRFPPGPSPELSPFPTHRRRNRRRHATLHGRVQIGIPCRVININENTTESCNASLKICQTGLSRTQLSGSARNRPSWFVAVHRKNVDLLPSRRTLNLADLHRGPPGPSNVFCFSCFVAWIVCWFVFSSFVRGKDINGRPWNLDGDEPRNSTNPSRFFIWSRFIGSHSFRGRKK